MELEGKPNQDNFFLSSLKFVQALVHELARLVGEARSDFLKLEALRLLLVALRLPRVTLRCYAMITSHILCHPPF